jgi:thiol-disulfide isomerase/thioredoxin
MYKRFLIPLALILLLALAACTGQTAGPTVVEVAPQSQEMAEADAMADESMDDDSEMMDDEAMDAADHEDMADENMDDDAEMMDDEAMDAADHEDMADENMDDDAEMMDDEAVAAGEGGEAMADVPAWQTVALTNAATGETFSLADFQGKTVFVEPMATWCTNCRQQQGQVREAKAQLSADDVVFVGLSLETSLPAGDLAQYARDNGFDWTYAVMSVELLDGLANEFGRSITSAPSTPHFIIRPDGSFTELSTGIDAAGDIVAMIQEAQG